MASVELPAAEQKSETVSQSEIEQLLSQFGAGEIPSAPAADASGKAPAALDDPSRYSFPELSFFSALELRKLRVRHEELIRYIGAQLASYLRLECVLQMSKLEAMPFRKFMNSLGEPTDLTLFELTPLRGTCLLEIPPRLGLCLVDRQLGGTALKVDNSRNLSEIEVKLVSRVAEVILTEWCSYWSSMLDLKPVIVGHESNSRFVESSAPDTMMLVLGVTSWVGGEIMDEMQLAFPHYTLEPLVRKLAAQSKREETPSAASAAGKSAGWNSSLDDLPVGLTAELPGIPLSTRTLSAMRPGDFIPLDPAVMRKVLIRVGGVPKFRAELGGSDNRRAVRIAGPLKARKA